MIVPILLGLFAVLLTTRYISGQANRSIKLPDGDRTVQTVPYWLLYVGHIPSLLLNPSTFLRWARQTYERGLVSLNLGGTCHTFVFYSSYAAHLLAQPQNTADSRPPVTYLLRSIFALPADQLSNVDAALASLAQCDDDWLSDAGIARLLAGITVQLKATSHDFVTFSPAPLDLLPWERTGQVGPPVESAAHKTAVSANIFALIKSHVVHALLTSLFGSDLLQNNPTFEADLDVLHASLPLLSSALPRWAPIPSLTSARIAVQRLSSALSAFATALRRDADGQDPGSYWTDLDALSEFVRARHEIYRRHNLTPDAAASLDLALIWTLVYNTSRLVYWTLVHLYADASTLSAARKEVNHYVVLSTPSTEFALQEPIRVVAVDHNALPSCYQLRSTVKHALESYSSAWESRHLPRDLLLSSTRTTKSHWKAASDKNSYVETYLLRQGSYAHVPCGRTLDPPSQSSDHDSGSFPPSMPARVQAFGIFARSRDGEGDGCTQLVERMVLAISGAIISLWNIDQIAGPDDGPHALNRAYTSIDVPMAEDGRIWGVRTPADTGLRVCISRRSYLVAI